LFWLRNLGYFKDWNVSTDFPPPLPVIALEKNQKLPANRSNLNIGNARTVSQTFGKSFLRMDINSVLTDFGLKKGFCSEAIFGILSAPHDKRRKAVLHELFFYGKPAGKRQRQRTGDESFHGI
jgi:hypothetical protein